jgi:hypothetical protein
VKENNDMFELTLANLKRTFYRAIELKQNFVGIRIRIGDLPLDEVLITPIENVDAKLKYYQETYDENLIHKNVGGIKIVGFSFGKSYSDIENDLGY